MLASWPATAPSAASWPATARPALTDSGGVSRVDTMAAISRPTMPTPIDRGERALDRERLDAQVLGAVDAEQHDHEQEQHDDRAGVDDHLHGGEEVRLHARRSARRRRTA